MARLFVHIGGEKTGSTTLQRFLFKNHRRLLERRVLYPIEPSLCALAAHFPVAAALLPPGVREFLPEEHWATEAEVFARIRALLEEDVDAVILSAEHFSSRFDNEHVRRLAALLKDQDVEIVLYVRRQDDLAISALSTSLIAGDRVWWNPDSVTPDNAYYDLERMTDRWADAFGVARITLRVFDRTELVGGDVVDDFLSLLGLSGEGLERVPQLNVSLSLEAAVVLRELNRVSPTWHESFASDGGRSFRRMQRARSEVVDALKKLPGIPATPLMRIAPAASRRRIQARFEESNARVAHKYLGRSWLFPSGTGATSQEADERALAEPDAEVLVAVIRALAERLADAR